MRKSNPRLRSAASGSWMERCHVRIRNILLLKEQSEWHGLFDGGLMQCVVRGAYLYAYLPVTTHNKIAGGAEMAFPIGLQVDGIGTHIHVQMHGVQRDAHVGGRFAGAVLDHTDGEHVGASRIRIHRERDRELL